MCCGFGVESLAVTKNACDTVVAAFFEVNPDRYRDAFHPKSRSHRTITTPGGQLGWALRANKNLADPNRLNALVMRH